MIYIMLMVGETSSTTQHLTQEDNNYEYSKRT